ncbi:FliG C-terminal domain-containing protein [Seohaeicola saemankumensis]|uniref:flagellar motor switch protein FliG n=1 Tax=Seohaeicola saemankumensis TaxID=481181 RepID=UPI0035CFECE8
MALALSERSFDEVAMLKLSPVSSRPGAPGIVTLSQREKAAIVVRFLLSEGAELTLADLPEDLQAALTVQFGQMRHVDRATLAAVVAEFAEELEQIALLFPRDVAGALTALDGRISPQTAARLRREAGVRQTGDPWDRLRMLPADKLLPFLSSESVEVAAVMLSKLDVAKSADLLSRLPGTEARRIAYAMSLTGAVTPDAVYRIGLSLAMQLDAVPDRAFSEDPEQRVGEILNMSSPATRDDVLTGLEETDAQFAQSVRRAIFTFADIPARINPRDAPKITRGLDQPTLVRALAHARALGGNAEDAADFILGNISQRMADGLREEVTQTGKVKVKAGEDAMSAVIATIRELVASGEMAMRQRGSDEEDE